ncbi:MAG: acetyl-CoA hydrolase/transferase C-terminal domain-containing protein [Pseudaminobacter sp.]
MAALTTRFDHIERAKVITSLMGPRPPYCSASPSGIEIKSFRGSPEVSDAITTGNVDVVPAHLSYIPSLLAGPLKPDVAIISVSPPDKDGWCSFGIGMLYHRSAAREARIVIAEVNENMPWTFGDSLIHSSEIDFFVRADHPIPVARKSQPTDAERAVAENVLEFIPDGATVQIGMGGMAEAMLEALKARRRIRVHAGVLSEGVIGLAQSGALDEKDGAITTGAFFGGQAVYDFARSNRAVHVHPVEYTHNSDTLRTFSPFVAINSALQIDLSGQANAETVKGRPISGTGGQLDFIRGAAMSENGLSILAITATSRDGKHARIVRQLDFGAGVTTPRTDVDVVITEYGAAHLRGRGLRERAAALAAIAAPTSIAELQWRD